MAAQENTADQAWTIRENVALASIEETEMVVSCEDETFLVQLSEDGSVYCEAYIQRPYGSDIHRFIQDWDPLELLDRIYDEIGDEGAGEEAEDATQKSSSAKNLDKALAFSVKAILVTGKLLVFTTKALYHTGRILWITLDAIFTAIDQMQGKQRRRSRPRFTATEKNALLNKQGAYCKGCNHRFAARNLTVDHIKALSKGELNG